MKQIIEYLLSKKNNKVNNDIIFKEITDFMWFDEIKEIFEQSSYELVENTKYEKENKDEMGFLYYNAEYIFKHFNTNKKQYLLGFNRDGKKFIFAMNPNYKNEKKIFAFHYRNRHEHGFRFCFADKNSSTDISREEAIKYLLD